MNRPTALLALLAAFHLVRGAEAEPNAARGAGPPPPAVESGFRTASVSGTGRGMVLFVEDPGNPIFGPLIKPDPGWRGTLLRILQASQFDWFGPTTEPEQNGPGLAVMQNYHLVIWNVYDYWWSANQGYPAALTQADQDNIEDYLASGGKVWLIGQDLLMSGVGRPWLTANFHTASADTDYWNGSLCRVRDCLKIPNQTVVLQADYQANGFWPDALTPDSQSRIALVDLDRTMPVALIYPRDRPISASFWTIDGRQPDPLNDWDYIVRKMLYDFGLPISIIDIGVDSIDIPRVVFKNTILYPRAKVRNYGTVTDTFSVHCMIDPGDYNAELDIVLPPDSARAAVFTLPFAFLSGFYTVTVFTDAEGDMDRSNDTLSMFVEATDWLYYDDGNVGSVWAWDDQNNGWGVHFPVSNDCFIDSLAFFIGDDSWPIPGGDTATFRVYRGSNRPETLRYEIRRAPVDRGSWNYLELDTAATFFPSGSDLFIFYVQVHDLPYCPGLAFDRVTDHPAHMWQLYNDSFSIALPGGDWMIRGHIRPIFGISEDEADHPAAFDVRLPSITGPRFEAAFRLERAGEVKLKVYDVNGRLKQITTIGALDPGWHRRSIRIDQPAGIYFLQVDPGSGNGRILKIVLVR